MTGWFAVDAIPSSRLLNIVIDGRHLWWQPFTPGYGQAGIEMPPMSATLTVSWGRQDD